MTGRDDGTRRAFPADPAADEPLPSGAAEPVDIAQVRADEALIEALRGSADLDVDDPIDDRLASLLQAWRDDIDDEPITPIDLDVAVAALTPAQPRRRKRYPLGPLASAAAVAMIAIVGLGIAANDAGVDSPLFAITKVVNPERAQSLQAAATVRRKLEEASIALNSGEVGRASSALQEAKQTLPNVMPDDDKQSLETEASQLEDMIENKVVGGVTTTASVAPTAPSGTSPVAQPPVVSPTPTASEVPVAPTSTPSQPTVPPVESTSSAPPSTTTVDPPAGGGGGGGIGGGESGAPATGSELGGAPSMAEPTQG